MKQKVYVQLKKGQDAAVCVGQHMLYPPTDFSDQDYIPMDPEDSKIKDDLEYHKDVLNVRKTKPKIKEDKKNKK